MCVSSCADFIQSAFFLIYRFRRCFDSLVSNSTSSILYRRCIYIKYNIIKSFEDSSPSNRISILYFSSPSTFGGYFTSTRVPRAGFEPAWALRPKGFSYHYSFRYQNQNFFTPLKITVVGYYFCNCCFLYFNPMQSLFVGFNFLF